MNFLSSKQFSSQPVQENFSQGVSFLKDKLQQAGDRMSELVLPINNFLKDVRDIEKEFDSGGKLKHDFSLYIDGKMIPAAEVLKMNMEENY